jgi:hypothetical protein
MADAKARSFGQFIRERRQQLNLTGEKTQRIKTSVPYIGHLEAAKRHPSVRLSLTLRRTRVGRCQFVFVGQPKGWFHRYPRSTSRTEPCLGYFRQRHEAPQNPQHNRPRDGLSRVAKLGDVQDPHDFIFVLNTIRQAFGQ